jgi:hypothetical protein
MFTARASRAKVKDIVSPNKYNIMISTKHLDGCSPFFTRNKGFDDDLFGQNPTLLFSVAFILALIGAVFIVHFRQDYDNCTFWKLHLPNATMVMEKCLPSTYGILLSSDMLKCGLKTFFRELQNIRNVLSTTSSGTATICEVDIAFKIFTLLCSAKTHQARRSVRGKKDTVATANLDSSAVEGADIRTLPQELPGKLFLELKQRIKRPIKHVEGKLPSAQNAGIKR